MIKAVVFDLDGTLVKLPIDYTLIREKLQKFFNTTDEFKPLMPTILKYCKDKESLLSEASSIICKEEQRAAKNLSIIDNSFEMLQTIKKIPNISVMLMTLQCSLAAHQIINEYNLSSIFTSITTRNEEFDRFIQIKNIINANNFTPSEILVIGDKSYDVISANKLGCKSILFNNSENKNLNVPKNTIQIADYSKLITLLKQL